MHQQPGVMLYFDRLPFLRRMDDVQRGRLFLLIIEYAQYGVVPDVDDPLIGTAWDILRPAIDLDAERYAAKCERNRENIRKRWNRASDTTVSDGIPKTNTKTNQKQTQTQTQKQSQSSQVVSPEAAEEMLRLAQKRRQEWEADRQCMTET